MHHRCQAFEFAASELPPPRGTSNSERTQTVKGGKGEAAIRRTLHSHSAPPVSARLCIAAVRCSDRAIKVSSIAPLLQPQQPVPGGSRSILPLTPPFISWLCSGTSNLMMGGRYTGFSRRSARGSTPTIVGGGSGSRCVAVGGTPSHIRGGGSGVGGHHGAIGCGWRKNADAG